MNIEALAISLVVALAAAVATLLAGRWWTNAAAKRIVDRVIRETPLDGSRIPPKLVPESLYIVEISDGAISCSRPDKTVERVRWDDLQSVELIHTDKGPFSPDVFWVLNGSDGGCVIPQGATGEMQLLERLQQLPGFDSGALMKGMSATGNRRLLCWRKEDTGG